MVSLALAWKQQGTYSLITAVFLIEYAEETMSSITIDLPADIYRRLEIQARRIGQDPATLSRELLESALEAHEAADSQTARRVLQAAGRVRSVGATLRKRIIPEVTLHEVRKILRDAAGPSLSEIIQAQRGAKA